MVAAGGTQNMFPSKQNRKSWKWFARLFWWMLTLLTFADVFQTHWFFVTHPPACLVKSVMWWKRDTNYWTDMFDGFPFPGRLDQLLRKSCDKLVCLTTRHTWHGLWKGGLDGRGQVNEWTQIAANKIINFPRLGRSPTWVNSSWEKVETVQFET